MKQAWQIFCQAFLSQSIEPCLHPFALITLNPSAVSTARARLFLLMMLIYGIIYSGWQLFFNFYILQNGFSRDFLGLVNSLPFAAGLIFGIPLGRLSDRIGRKASLIIGFLFYSIALLMEITFRQSDPDRCLCILVRRLQYAFHHQPGAVDGQASNEQNRTMLFSLNYGLQTIAGAVGSLFAGQLPALFGTILHVNADSATAYQAVLIVSDFIGNDCADSVMDHEGAAIVSACAGQMTVQKDASSGLPSKQTCFRPDGDDA